jgi:hypothetical protein
MRFIVFSLGELKFRARLSARGMTHVKHWNGRETPVNWDRSINWAGLCGWRDQ